MFLLTPEDYTILSGDHVIERTLQRLDEIDKPIELEDFPHFMLKEIWEQPRVLEDVFRGRIQYETNDLHSDTLETLSTE